MLVIGLGRKSLARASSAFMGQPPSQLRLLYPAVHARDDEQSNELDYHAAYRGNRHGLHHIRTATLGEENGDEADDGGCCSHEARSYTLRARFDNDITDFLNGARS